MHAICDSLTSLNSSLLEVLTIHAVSWTADIFNAINECDCNQTTLFKRFARIMERKPLIGSKRLELNLDQDLDIGVVAKELENCNKGGYVSFSCYWDGHFQHNSLGSIGRLVYTHEH